MASPFRSTPHRPPSYFATADKQLPFLMGKVKNPGGPDKFLAPDEAHLLDLPRLYRQQPALFQPRDQWDFSSSPAGGSLPAKDDTADVIRREFADRQRSCFPPPQGWATGWREHACCLWELWLEIDREKMLKSNSVVELLPLLSYGIEDIVCLARRELIIYDASVHPNSHFGMSQGKSFRAKSPFLAGYQDKVSCEANLGFSTPLDFRHAMHGRRFLAGIIHFQSVPHFTTYIFDRARAHFYHFDTLGDLPYTTPGADQAGRMRCAVLAMREALMWAGQPFYFDFFSVPVSQQPSSWECGILSVFCLFLTLRGLVGNQCTDLVDMYRPKPVTIEGHDHINSVIRLPELPLRDWILVDGGDPELSRDRISAWFQRVIMDELGVPGAKCLEKGKNPSRVYYGRHAGLIKCPGDDLSSLRLPIPQLYTRLGGYQPIAFDNVETANAWARDRLLPLPSIQGTGSYRTSRAAGSGGVFAASKMSEPTKTWYNERGVEIKDNLPHQPRPRADHIDLDGPGGAKATSKPGTPSKAIPPSTPSRPGIDGTPAKPTTPASQVSSHPPPANTPSLGIKSLSIETPTKPGGAHRPTPSRPTKASIAPSPSHSARDQTLPAPKAYKTRLVVEVPGPSSRWNTPSPVAPASNGNRSPASLPSDSPGSLRLGRDYQRASPAVSPATAVMTWTDVASRGGSPATALSRRTTGPGHGSLRSRQYIASAPGSPGGSAYSPSNTSSAPAESDAPASPLAPSRLADPAPRRRLRPAVDSPPSIWAAEQVPCEEVAQQQDSAGDIGSGANIMSRIPGTSVELA